MGLCVWRGGGLRRVLTLTPEPWRRGRPDSSPGGGGGVRPGRRGGGEGGADQTRLAFIPTSFNTRLALIPKGKRAGILRGQVDCACTTCTLPQASHFPSFHTQKTQSLTCDRTHPRLRAETTRGGEGGGGGISKGNGEGGAGGRLRDAAKPEGRGSVPRRARCALHTLPWPPCRQSRRAGTGVTGWGGAARRGGGPGGSGVGRPSLPLSLPSSLHPSIHPSVLGCRAQARAERLKREGATPEGWMDGVMKGGTAGWWGGGAERLKLMPCSASQRPLRARGR